MVGVAGGAEHRRAARRVVLHGEAVRPARSRLAEQLEDGAIVAPEGVIIAQAVLERPLGLVARPAIGGVVRVDHRLRVVQRRGDRRRRVRDVLDALVGVAAAQRQAPVELLVEADDADVAAALRGVGDLDVGVGVGDLRADATRPRRPRCRPEIVARAAVGQRADADRPQIGEGDRLDRLVEDVVGAEVDAEQPVVGRQRDAVEGRQAEPRIDRGGRRGDQRRGVGGEIGVDRPRDGRAGDAVERRRADVGVGAGIGRVAGQGVGADRRRADDAGDAVLDRAGVRIAVGEIDVGRAAAEDAVAAAEVQHRRRLVVEADARLDGEQAAEVLAVAEAVAVDEVLVLADLLIALVEVVAQAQRDAQRIADLPVVLQAEGIDAVLEARRGVVRVERQRVLIVELARRLVLEIGQRVEIIAAGANIAGRRWSCGSRRTGSAP